MKEITYQEAAEIIAQAVKARATLELSSGHFTARNNGREHETRFYPFYDTHSRLEWDGVELELFSDKKEYYLDQAGERELILIKAPGELVSLRMKAPRPA